MAQTPFIYNSLFFYNTKKALSTATAQIIAIITKLNLTSASVLCTLCCALRGSEQVTYSRDFPCQCLCDSFVPDAKTALAPRIKKENLEPTRPLAFDRNC